VKKKEAATSFLLYRFSDLLINLSRIGHFRPVDSEGLIDLGRPAFCLRGVSGEISPAQCPPGSPRGLYTQSGGRLSPPAFESFFPTLFAFRKVIKIRAV